MIWLASQSPRRQALLTQIGIAFEPLLPESPAEAAALEALEDPIGREAPRRYVERVTRLKLDAALARVRIRGLADRPVLVADTTVALGRTILGKPTDADEALRMLRSLSGVEHRVLTAVALGRGRRRAIAVSVSTVRFARVPLRDLRAYVATGEPFGKAGAYALQGRAAAFVEHVSGSPSGIVGLPLRETAELLAAFTIRA